MYICIYVYNMYMYSHISLLSSVNLQDAFNNPIANLPQGPCRKLATASLNLPQQPQGCLQVEICVSEMTRGADSGVPHGAGVLMLLVVGSVF